MARSIDGSLVGGTDRTIALGAMWPFAHCLPTIGEIACQLRAYTLSWTRQDVGDKSGLTPLAGLPQQLLAGLPQQLLRAEFLSRNVVECSILRQLLPQILVL
jgi:hypothetical protein